MSDSIDVDTALLAYLGGDPLLQALAPDGVWYDTAPPGSRAFVLLAQLDHVDEYVLNGRLWERILYFVEAVTQDTSPATASEAADRIFVLLQAFAGYPIATYQIALARRVERVREVEIDESTDLRWQHIGGHYEILAAPLQVTR